MSSLLMSAKRTSGYSFFCMGMLNYNKEKELLDWMIEDSDKS